MTPMEELREAARLMRERATAATPSGEDPYGWYTPDGQRMYGGTTEGGCCTGLVYDVDDDCDSCSCTAPTLVTAAHIASWHPAVALAVADWLDAEVDLAGLEVETVMTAALAVARAYLGTTP